MGVQAAQPRFVFGHALGEQIEHGGLFADRPNQKVAQHAAVQGVELVCRRAALRSDGGTDEVQFDDPGHDRFVGDHCRVLADGDRPAKRWLVGFVAGRLHALGGQGAAAVVILEFVPLERLGVRAIITVAIGFQEHDGHAGHLAHQP